MMKYGKSISVEELFEPVLCALRCRWRLKQALLLLSLQTGQVAYWQNGEHSWQEQLDEECLTNKQRLADTLREMLLKREVEEGAMVLLLPAAAMMHSEQMVLPSMRRRELQAVLKWEIQQSVPWPEEDYTYSFEATEFSEAGEQQYQVTFTALQDTSRAELEHLCSSLLLKLQGICDSDVNADVLGNHKERPEVKEAIEKGSGKSIRTSNTLSHASYYYAIRLSNGNILRLAKESQSFFSFLIRVSPFIGGIAILLFVVSIFLSRLFAKSIVKPIEMLAKNMDREELATGYKELTPFLNTIQKQHRDIVKNSNMRQEFTANVSHELKTPLTSISGYSELIAGGMAKGEDVVRFAGEIQKNSSRLLTLINDILQLSELDTRNFNDDFAWVNFADTVRNCGDLLALTAEKRKVMLHLETVPEVVMIHGVAKMLEELAYNLIDNGIRYNKEDGQVVVCLRETESTVIFCVKDTGIGISKENQERIFERFYRVDKGRSRETGGTGLGLAIVKHIVAVHHADIEVTSEEDKGTEITVTFHKENE